MTIGERTEGAERAGAAPPLVQCRRLPARDRVARASWSIASPDRSDPPTAPANRANAHAAPRVSASPIDTLNPRSAQSSRTTSNRAASPPKRWAHPVKSTTNPSVPSGAAQGLNLPAQRCNTAKKPASANGSRVYVCKSGQTAWASRTGCPT